VHGQEILIVQFADAAVAAGTAPDGTEDVYSLEMLLQQGRVVVEVTAVFARARI
jgi:hypothetical protein